MFDGKVRVDESDSRLGVITSKIACIPLIKLVGTRKRPQVRINFGKSKALGD